MLDNPRSQGPAHKGKKEMIFAELSCLSDQAKDVEWNVNCNDSVRSLQTQFHGVCRPHCIVMISEFHCLLGIRVTNGKGLCLKK
jgi:hypothetical protein